MKILQITHDYFYTSVYPSLFSAMENATECVVTVPAYANERTIEGAPDENDRIKVLYCCERKRFSGNSNAKKCSERIIDEKLYTNVDVVHAHFLCDGAIAMYIRKKIGIPYAVTVRGSCFIGLTKYSRPYTVLLYLSVLKHASRVFFLSKSTMEKTLLHVPFNMRRRLSDKSAIIPNGIDNYWHDNRYMKKRELITPELRIITVGSISRLKNQYVVIEALDKLIQKGYKIYYEVVGDIEDHEVYERLISKPYVRYVAKQAKEDLIKRYRDSDIFVMVSHSETFGLVYGEALTQGLPVVYTKGQGFDGQFAEGYVGYHANSRSVEEIVLAVEKIINRYSILTSNALEASKNFSWSKVAESTTLTYKAIIEGK